MSYDREHVSISIHLCKIYEVMISCRAVSHWISNWYLSIEEDLKQSLAVIVSLMVAGTWQCCPSLSLLLSHPRPSTSAKSPSWRPDSSHSHNHTVRRNHVSRAALGERQQETSSFSPRPHADKSVSRVRRVGNTLHERLELGTWLSWLSLPAATVTDVLFNTRAGSSSGWSEYKLAQCLLQGGCIASAATKYFTCKLIPSQSGLMGHLCSSCYFTLFSFKKKNPKETVPMNAYCTQSMVQDEMFALNISTNQWFATCHITNKTCNFTFTLHAHDLTFMSGGGSEAGDLSRR